MRDSWIQETVSQICQQVNDHHKSGVDDHNGLQRDYAALQSIMVIYAGFVVVVNLLTDLTYGFLNPRITH